MNFESQSTHDYRNYVQPHEGKEDADRLFLRDCFIRLRELLYMAISAAKKLDARTVRIPGLGTGQFSRELSVVQDRIVKHLFDFILGDLQALKEFKGLELQYRFP